MDLIDRNALIKDIKRDNCYDLVAVKKVENAPTIDPVHAAGACYCRECKWFSAKSAKGVGWCREVMARPMEPDDFCSYGKPKERANE